jgi:pheromone shutdown protein TraB
MSRGEVRVVGTAHVSADSVEEVEDVVRSERPDVVAVELDEGRYRQLQGGEPDDVEPADLLRGNTVFQFLAYWLLSYVQTRMGERFDVTPGADMMAAVETAEELGVDVALVDRDIQTTIQRFWSRLSVVEKARMVGGLLFGVTDARVAGLTLGLFAGLVFGPLVGLFGGRLGVTDLLLTRATGAVLVAVAAGLVLDTAGGAFVSDADRGLLLTLGGAVAAGIVGGFGLGVADGLVGSYLSGFVVGAVGSMAIGLAAGAVVGVVAAVVFDVTGVGATDADVEEFDPTDLTDTDVVTAMLEEFREFSPGGAEALIDERDAFIAHRLVELRASGRDVVAVVGAGHREGIESYLRNPETLPPMASLVGEESGGFAWGKAIGVLVSVAFVGFFALLAMAGVRNGLLLRLFAAWFLVNGVFAAGLARLAGARWSSSVVGGLVAWLTSVNPLLAPGWFTGYMELRHTPVNVSDIGRLNELLADEETPIRQLVGRMFDVPLFRLIMVVAATNVGSVVASALFVAYVLPLFAAELNGAAGVSELMVQGARNSAEIVWRTVT